LYRSVLQETAETWSPSKLMASTTIDWHILGLVDVQLPTFDERISSGTIIATITWNKKRA